jgi:hypothetical protein
MFTVNLLVGEKRTEAPRALKPEAIPPQTEYLRNPPAGVTSTRSPMLRFGTTANYVHRHRVGLGTRRHARMAGLDPRRTPNQLHSQSKISPAWNGTWTFRSDSPPLRTTL